MPTLEPQVNALWVAKQSAKGSPVAGVAATKRMVQVGGNLEIARADGNERYSDGSTRFGSATDFIDTLSGGGDPVIQSHPDQLAYLCWLFFGQETVTGVADPWTHVFTPGSVGPFYSTWWKRVGQAVGPVRQKFNDVLISQLVIDGSQGQKVLHATPSLLCLDPGEVMTTDPSPGLPTTDPLLFTEAQGVTTIDTIAYKVNSFQLSMNEDRSLWYGDDVRAADAFPGTPTITIAVTLLVDSTGLAEYYKRYYGTATPAVNAKPTRYPDALGAFDTTFTKQTSAGAVSPARSARIEVPGIRWVPDAAVAPNQAGGATELTLTGEARVSGANPLVRVTVLNGSAAYTV